MAPKPGLYQAGASAQHMLQQLAAWQKTSSAEALVGARVLAVGARAEHGVVARALRTLASMLRH